jgi:hypothetical protein
LLDFTLFCLGSIVSVKVMDTSPIASEMGHGQ